MQKAQGAIEYLLLLAASVVVVAVVISYMAGTLDIGGSSLEKETLDGICALTTNGGLDQNSLLCGCYLKQNTKGDFNTTGQYNFASKYTCPEMLSEYKSSQYTTWD